MKKVKRFNSTQPLASVKGGHWVKASDYDALWCKLAEVEAERDKAKEDNRWAYIAGAFDETGVAEATLPAVYRLGLEAAAGQCKTHFIDAGPTARREHKAGEDIAAAIRSTPTPTAAELMARIKTGEKG